MGTLSYDHFKRRSVESWIRYQGSFTTRVGVEKFETFDPGVFAARDVYQISSVAREVIRGELLNVIDIYDSTDDERMAWAIAMQRDGFLDIEELFVRPPYRRRGYASRLANALLETAESLERPVRLWVSYADCGDENRAALDGLLKKLGLSLWNSPVPWAAYVGLADSSPHELRPPVMLDRPAMSRGAWKTARAAILATSLVAGPSESIAAEPARAAVTLSEDTAVPTNDPPTIPAPAHDDFEDDLPPGVEYNLVLTAPPSEIIPCMGRVEAIVRGREDLPMSDEDWRNILIEDDED